MMHDSFLCEHSMISAAKNSLSSQSSGLFFGKIAQETDSDSRLERLERLGHLTLCERPAIALQSARSG